MASVHFSNCCVVEEARSIGRHTRCIEDIEFEAGKTFLALRGGRSYAGATHRRALRASHGVQCFVAEEAFAALVTCLVQNRLVKTCWTEVAVVGPVGAVRAV